MLAFCQHTVSLRSEFLVFLLGSFEGFILLLLQLRHSLLYLFFPDMQAWCAKEAVSQIGEGEEHEGNIVCFDAV